MKKFHPVLAVLILFFNFTINAEADPAETGFYFGGGAAYAWENFDGEFDFDDTWGLNAFAGYRFTRHIACEGNFNWYDDFESNSTNADVEIWTLMLDLKAMYPVYNDRLVPYLRVGGGYMHLKASAGSLDAINEDFAYNFGGGLDFYLTDPVSIALDGKYVVGTEDLDAVEYFVGTINLAIHF